MQYLLFDTCIWLNLATKPESRLLLKSILTGLKENKLKLLLSDVTIKEYEKNKNSIIGKYTDSLNNHLKNAKKIQDYLAPSEQKAFLLLLKKAEDKICLSAKQGTNALDVIEKIFRDSNTHKLICSDEIWKCAAQLALDKKAPFHRNKNSIADALIYLQFKDCVEKVKKIDSRIEFYFVTDNFKDFSSSLDHREPHEDFVIFHTDNVNYYIDPYKALERLDFNNIPPDEFDLFEIGLRMLRYASSPCISEEGHSFNEKEGRWFHSQFGGGLSWHLMCRKCGALQDTGDFFD